ncbi:hypothetical protein [Adhaeribacter soli]|nr:hypothetical protein [Adhaeribacter soli]
MNRLAKAEFAAIRQLKQTAMNFKKSNSLEQEKSLSFPEGFLKFP